MRVVAGCGFAFWPDLSESRVQAFIGGLRTEGRAVKQFCRWMVRDGRAPEGPMAYLNGGNVRLDRRHDRRAFDANELRSLLDTTRNAATRYKMTGPERALLYRLAVETGLRAGEIRNLTPQSFDLEGEPRSVTVEAAYSKHRREDVQPLPSSPATELQAFRV